MKTMLNTHFLTIAGLAVIAALGVAQSASAAEKDVYNYEAQRNAPAGTRRIVFIATKGAHGGRGNHEFMAGSLYFARHINAVYPRAYAVVYSDDKWPKDLSKADAIIVLLNHGGPAAQDTNIKAAVERGAGFMAIHFGVEVNKGAQGDNYLDWMGGYFETFYSVNPWWSPEFQVASHPTTRGVKPFKVRDEWYYHIRFRDQMKGVTAILTAVAPPSTISAAPSERGGNADVFKAVQAGEPQATAWAYERPGGGRGFGFTGFHDYYNLTNDSFRTLLLNGIAWTAKLDVPPSGVPSTTPSKAELEALMDEVHGPAKS
jgi:type 1 glutamine amidotransferase